MIWKNVAVAFVLVAGSTLPSTAAVVEFTTRADFVAAAGASTTETFDSIAPDTQFRTQAVDVGTFAIAGFGPNQASWNAINPTPAPGNTIYNVNGSSFIVGATDVDTGFSITFDSAITAFGADFRGLNNQDNVARTFVVVNGTELEAPIVAGNDVGSFFGFVSDTPFTTITFIRNPDLISGHMDAFGMDNVTFATGAVPEPSTWAMMIVGFAGLGLATYRRRKITTVAA